MAFVEIATIMTVMTITSMIFTNTNDYDCDWFYCYYSLLLHDYSCDHCSLHAASVQLLGAQPDCDYDPEYNKSCIPFFELRDLRQ